jgi:hypothetical protein
MWIEPFFADGELFVLTTERRAPQGYEPVGDLEALHVSAHWPDARRDELRAVVLPRLLCRRVSVRPQLDDIEDPLDLVDLLPADRPAEETEHWIEVRVLDEAHAALPGIDIAIAAPDGKEASGKTDAAGSFLVDGLFKPGSCRVELLDLTDAVPKTVMELVTDRVHTIVVPGLAYVTLCLLDFEQMPVSGSACTLRLGGSMFVGTTDGEGSVSFRVSSAFETSDGLLESDTNALGHRGPRPLELSPVPAVADPVGQRLRLDNLGYVPVDAAANDPPSQYAIEEFQCDHGLSVTGVMDGATQAKLVEAHGH